MSKMYPNKLARKFRECQDTIISYTAQPAILYRYEGQVSSQSTAPNPAEEFYEDHHLSDTRNIFSDPIKTQARIKWPESLKVTRQGQINVSDEDSISGRMKYKDQPTIESYIKTPLTTALGPENIDEDVYTDLGEKDMVVRLEIVDIESTAEDNDARMDVTFNIKRTDDNLHPNDTDALTHVDESDFFV